MHGPVQKLPSGRTPLIGRQRERAAVTARLQRDDTGVLTLTGPGGVGKTSLALQVAHDLLAEFDDGVVVVPLASLRDPALVPGTVAQALGTREAAGHSVLEILLEYLSGKQMLLVLDNFEHLLPAATLVADLLAASPRLKVLATSRAPLHLRGERVFAVEPLSLPPRETTYSPELALQSPAVALFVRRAQDVRTDFALTDVTAPLIVEICRRVDGLPLALELAAVRIKVLSPHALLRRLERRLPMLTGGARDAPERQQTLRATIAWSYDLLTPAEQVLFRHSAVFVGGCTQEAVESVCAGAGFTGIELLDALGSLVDKHMLQRAEARDGEPRFFMLETIREFADDQLVTSGHADAVRERHATFFLAFADEAECKTRIGQQTVWLRRVDAEHDNLRAALDWLSEHAHSGATVRLAGDLWFYWMVRGHLTEGRRRLVAALGITGADALGVTRARALFGAGWLAKEQADHDRAVPFYHELDELGRATGDKWCLTYAAIGLGSTAVLCGADVVGREYLERALALALLTDDLWAAAWIAAFLTPALIRQGDLLHAQRLLEQSVAIRRRLDDPHGLSASLATLADVAVARGELSVAQRLASEALEVTREIDDRVNLAARLRSLTAVALDQGDHCGAAAYSTEALQIARELGQTAGLATAVEGLAIAAARSANPERAVILFGAAAALRGRTGQLAHPGWPERIARGMDMASAGLSDEVAAALLEQGRTLSPDELAMFANARSVPESLTGPAVDAPSRAAYLPSNAPPRRRPGGLTERQLEVARLIGQGQTNRQIAAQLVVSERTAEHHVENILTKLALSSRTQVGIWAVEHGLTTTAPLTP
jgi:predicted ATPase/DNA-binding CsgD family transcriptional regulator